MIKHHRNKRGGQHDDPNRDVIAAETREERDRLLRERIALMSEDRKNDLLFKACEKYPSLALDITKKSSNQARETGQGHHSIPEGTAPSWCTCSRCREMPSETKIVCCRQIPGNCFSTLPDFDLIAQDNLVLALNQRYREDVFAYAPDEDFNRGRRHAAYRQFILWQHGYLGAGNRRVIPSCCVWKIRDKFPDNFGQYRGFDGGGGGSLG